MDLHAVHPGVDGEAGGGAEVGDDGRDLVGAQRAAQATAYDRSACALSCRRRSPTERLSPRR